MSARSKEGVGFPVTSSGIDPVPRGGGVDQVEALRLSPPTLEGSDMYLNGETSEVLSCAAREFGAKLDAQTIGHQCWALQKARCPPGRKRAWAFP